MLYISDWCDMENVIVCWIWSFIFQLIDVSRKCAAGLVPYIKQQSHVNMVYCMGPTLRLSSEKLNADTFTRKNCFIWSCSYFAMIDNIFVIVNFFSCTSILITIWKLLMMTRDIINHRKITTRPNNIFLCGKNIDF